MELIQDIAINNPCYKTGKKIKIQGIMLEGVGCPQPSARVFAHNWNRENCEGRCAHAFIDATSELVIQTLPWNHRGWHCGRHPGTKNSANNTHIGLKMCQPTQIRYNKKHRMELVGDKELAIAVVKQAYKNAVELLAMLCEQFNLNPMKDIISPKEGYQKRVCAFRNDVEGLWELLDIGYTMDGLRKDVKTQMSLDTVEDEKVEEKPISVSGIVPEPVADVLTCAPKVEIEPESEPIPNMRIRVDVDNLRIRSTPEIANNVTGKYTGKGVFEITEIQNGSGSKSGWGKLADGSGWVCLDYVVMLN